MPTDTITVTLPPDLAAFFGVARLEVEAVAMTGAAMFRGASVNGQPVAAPPELWPELEALFVAAMKARVTDDVVTIGDANARNRKAPVSAGKVLASKNYAGYRRMRQARRAGRMAWPARPILP